jgi:hypothetical protein
MNCFKPCVDAEHHIPEGLEPAAAIEGPEVKVIKLFYGSNLQVGQKS